MGLRENKSFSFSSIALLAFSIVLALFLIWPYLVPASKPPRTLVLYGFSILGETISEGIFPAFQKMWKEKTGEQVSLISSFAGSGTVRNLLKLGVPAEIAILAHEGDALKLVSDGILPESTWRKLPYQGVINGSPFIFLVRPGNPLKLTDFADLAKTNVRVIHADPLLSGGAQWAIAAEYGAGFFPDRNRILGFTLLSGIWKNVASQASSARAARTQFENGFGDALITYEQEGLRDKIRGKAKFEIVYPKLTVLSQHITVRIDKNIPTAQRELVDTFLNFLWSDQAQLIFADFGFRPVNFDIIRENPNFPKDSRFFTMSELGGWPVFQQEIIEDIWHQKILMGKK